MRRLESIRDDPNHAVYVAVSDGRVVGWLHAFVSRLVESDLSGGIGGLVDENFRGKGIGRLLMKRVEVWARQKGCQSVSLRSNITREDAHSFCEKLGYIWIKTQHAFRKSL